MKVESFKIGKQIICRNTTIEELERTGIYRVARGIDTTRVNSQPHKVNFFGGCFLVSFLFYDSALAYVFLRPVVDGENAPDYPDALYQEKKWKYCVNLIKNNEKRGTVVEDSDTRFAIKLSDCELYCDKILWGKDRYTGGNIIIQFTKPP